MFLYLALVAAIDTAALSINHCCIPALDIIAGIHAVPHDTDAHNRQVRNNAARSRQAYGGDGKSCCAGTSRVAGKTGSLRSYVAEESPRGTRASSFRDGPEVTKHFPRSPWAQGSAT